MYYRARFSLTDFKLIEAGECLFRSNAKTNKKQEQKIGRKEIGGETITETEQIKKTKLGEKKVMKGTAKKVCGRRGSYPRGH